MGPSRGPEKWIPVEEGAPGRYRQRVDELFPRVTSVVGGRRLNEAP